MNSPTSGEGGREDDASRQSRSDKLRAGGSLPEPECTPPHGAATLPGRAENPSDGRKRAADRICGRRNPARAVGKAVPPDEFSDIRRRRERRRCVPAKPTGQAPRGRFVAGAGMPPAARGGDIAGACRKSVRRAKEGRGAGVFRCGTHLRTPQSRTGDRKGGAPDEFSDIRRRRERRRCVPAKPIGQAPRGRFVAGAGMPPAARGGDIAGACRKSVRRAKEGRGAGVFRCGTHLRTPQSRTGDRKGGAPDEFSDIRRRRERRRCVPAKPIGQAPRGRFVAGAGMHPAARGGDIAGACRKSVGRAKEGRGPHLRTPQSRTGGRKGGAPDEFSDIRRRRERRRCVPAKPTGQAPRGQRTGGLECKL